MTEWYEMWVQAWVERGFTHVSTDEEIYAVLEGKGVRLAIGHPNNLYPLSRGAVIADNEKVFDKFSKAVLRIRLPRHPDTFNWDRALIALAYLAQNPRFADESYGYNQYFLWED